MIFRPPVATGYAPYGTSVGSSGTLNMFLEEYEALRLADYEGLSQLDAAERMGVSRPTFTRIYEQARRKMAQVLVEGLTLVISGGNAQFDAAWFRCDRCSTAFAPSEETLQVKECPVCRSTHIRRLAPDTGDIEINTIPRPVIYQTGYCACPRCGLKVSHQAGIQCRSMACSGCGTMMIREHRPM